MSPIEAVTVCVGYGDFLAETARHNLHAIDRWIIVTTPDDEETREVCRVHDLQTILSDNHRLHLGNGRFDSAFNKGAMVERGLQHCSRDAWRLHLDSDVVLPSSFRRMVGAAELHEQKIYGADRLMIHGWDQWKHIERSGWLNHTHCSVNLPAGIQVGTRWALERTGYVPIGFFQMWHGAADEWRGRRHRTYPVHHGDACRTDVQHALQWDRRNRELLAEILVLHLDSGNSALGSNWNGRTTPRFGPFDQQGHQATGGCGPEVGKPRRHHHKHNCCCHPIGGPS